ncbi:target of rapamycin complex 2 subunit MAPKAP1 isoform X3 [Neoarius graeffei]|uniref:target of rapamycin complex 2 subunit MAPKAP1 isoform X3 n=1 Tax=Neoarius graeffei TaxID=443677 RepID=UPI00298D3AAD|nr:target of rapamycin complex 2 subunit MAPKAP1 isoform X3 [Neoarius graeffei]
MRMAFLDNPTIILAHIRQSHVTSDDSGMCEMVLIDHDVDFEKCYLGAISTGSGLMGLLGDGIVGGDMQPCELSQSVDITSSWDFGIRRRSNTGEEENFMGPKPTAQRLERLRKERQNQIKCKNIPWKERTSSQSAEDLSFLFEKKDFKERPRSTGTKSTLSLRLEQCPQQLNNPFNEYSKFDGKGHVGTTATKKIDVYLSMQSTQEKLHPMMVVTMANARVHDLIGLICWQYTSEGREPKLNENVNTYCLHIAEDDGEVDTDFPPLDSNEPIHKFGFSTLALVEKYSSPGLGPKQSLFVRINAAHGFSLIPVDNLKVTMKEILQKALKKRKGSQKGSGISGEKVEIDPVTNQKTSTKFWIRQKPISIDSDLLCACDLVEEKSPSHAIFKLTYLSNHDYKVLYFECDAATVNEIVLKVNYILESRASTSRAEYFAQKQRKLSRRTSFSFQKDKKSSQ